MREPAAQVEQEQAQDGFEGEEAVEAVRTRLAQGGHGIPNDKYRTQNKSDPSVHVLAFLPLLFLQTG